MPTQTKFVCPSGGLNVDFSGVFEELNGGTTYGTATNFKVGALDLTGYFHASTSVNDRPSFNTGFKLNNGADLSTIFRRRGFNQYTLTAIFADIVGGVSPYNSNGDISGKTVVYGSTYEVTARSYSGYTFSHWQTNTSPHNLTYVEGTSYTDETIKITIGAINTEIEAIYTED